MPLTLIRGPLNSGRAGLIRRGFLEALDRDPVLVVPTLDDVFSFEREICASGAALGGSVLTFEGLFAEVATATGCPPARRLTPSQRRRLVAAAVAARRDALGPLRRSASRGGFPVALEHALDELQAAGLGPQDLEAHAATLESSAYLADLATLFGSYAELRGRLGFVDSHQIAWQAIEGLRQEGHAWSERPVFVYGLDDLTPSQLELVKALAAVCEVTIALPYEERPALAARAGLLEQLRALGPAREIETAPDPDNTPSPLLFELERRFGSPEAEPLPQHDGGLAFLRSAGERGEAEAIGAEVAALLARGARPDEIAVAVRDPARRGPLIAEVLESYGVPVALEAEAPVATTAVGGTLIALLQAELGERRADQLMRYLRGASGISPGRVDWFERALRRARAQSAAEALSLWQGEEPSDLARIRAAAAAPAAELASEVGRLAETMASRPLRDRGDGPRPARGEGRELRAAGAISKAMRELRELGGLEPGPRELIELLERLELRLWSGPVEGRVRIASPYGLRAARFPHVFVASLQDGEFPRQDRGDPFLSDSQRAAIGLPPRRDAAAEELYLFYVCLSRATESLYLSYRDSDEAGAAAARSPFLDEVRRLLAPTDGDDPEEPLTRARELAQVVHPVAEAPSESELARALAARGDEAEAEALLAAASAPPAAEARVRERLAAARRAEEAARAPGPLRNPAVLEALAVVPAYGGTTLEDFDVCSYRWFVGHELDPQPLDPLPEALTQGKLMHGVLERLYREKPGGDPLPRPASLALWLERGRELVREIAAELGLGGRPGERALTRGLERLLCRFLEEESRREAAGFSPWRLEARFGEGEDCERPPLDLGGWGLHGAVDRVDRAPDGRALVIDYKVAGSVTPLDKFEEKARLQLQLYLLAVREHWGATPIAGLYHPLRATSKRRPRGLVLADEAANLGSYDLYGTDQVDAVAFEAALAEARERATRIVGRMRRGDIARDPGPREGLRDHDVCPSYCEFAPICRRDRAPVAEAKPEAEEE